MATDPVVNDREIAMQPGCGEPKLRCGARLLGWMVAPLLCAAGWQLVGALRQPAPQEVRLAGYATSLAGRSANQRFNAARAARLLDGRVVPAGAVFSFNRTVRSWTWDAGYRKAPVSYDGEMVRAFGGGVCQTSTTLYNAVLLAGLPILERHPHVYAPHYVPPGRDAAVAQYDVDLRFRNPFSWPIRIRASATAGRLDVALYGPRRPDASVEVKSEVLRVARPRALTRTVPDSPERPRGAFVRNPGAVGYRVVTYRLTTRDGRVVRRERISDDSYPAMDRLVQIGRDSHTGAN
jgi:vancomycin resistance protein YoaR